MAAKGQKYQHKQITDVIYTVDAVNNGLVFLVADSSQREVVKVSLANLEVYYKRVS